MSSTNAKKIEPHKRAYPSENGGLEKTKKDRRTGQWQKKRRQKERQDQAEEQKRRYRKVGSN